jgi:hypothetical protein
MLQADTFSVSIRGSCARRLTRDSCRLMAQEKAQKAPVKITSAVVLHLPSSWSSWPAMINIRRAL